MYRRIKLDNHQQDYLLKLIVSTVRSSMHKVAKFLSILLVPYKEEVDSYLWNRDDLVDRLKDLQFKEE